MNVQKFVEKKNHFIRVVYEVVTGLLNVALCYVLLYPNYLKFFTMRMTCSVTILVCSQSS